MMNIEAEMIELSYGTVKLSIIRTAKLILNREAKKIPLIKEAIKHIHDFSIVDQNFKLFMVMNLRRDSGDFFWIHHIAID